MKGTLGISWVVTFRGVAPRGCSGSGVWELVHAVLCGVCGSSWVATPPGFAVGHGAEPPTAHKSGDEGYLVLQEAGVREYPGLRSCKPTRAGIYAMAGHLFDWRVAAYPGNRAGGFSSVRGWFTDTGLVCCQEVSCSFRGNAGFRRPGEGHRPVSWVEKGP